MTLPVSGSAVRPEAITTADDLVIALEERLPAIGHAGTRIERLTQLSGGASMQTWLCEAHGPDGDLRLILRRDQPDEPRPDVLRREATALEAAGRHAVPGPRLLDWSDEAQRLGGAYLLMTFVPGETIARRILRDRRFAGARRRLVADLGRAAALIHQIPVSQTPGIADADGVELLRERYRDADVPRPVFELAFKWLADHQPSPGRTALVHGDFRLGNVIVDEDGLAAVLDWELVHRGDPMEDLGYLSIRAWRFGGSYPVAGLGGFNELFDAYESVSGIRPDPARVRWWQVAGTLNWGVSCIVQANRHLRGGHRSVELAAIGRRVAEQEFDLLRMIDPMAATR